MMDAIQELKTRAEILHKRIAARDGRALARLRALPELRRASDESLTGLAATIRRQDCLTVIAAELGFSNWPQAKAAITGEGDVTEFGTLLYRGGGHLNQWFARYEEAAPARVASNGYLLAYKRQYLVVDRYFIESLGLDPDDPDWIELDYDWVRPASMSARTRLYGKLIAGLPREAVLQ
ncbi:MAG: hypothetical protein ACRD4P_13565 [Bryobacteraceae bacterium]